MNYYRYQCLRIPCPCMTLKVLSLGTLLLSLSCVAVSGQDVSNWDGKIEPGISLVHGAYKMYLQRKTPLLLNCSVDVTDPSLRPLNFYWYRDGSLVDLSNKPNPKKVYLEQNGSLYLPGLRGKKQGKQDGLYECKVNTTKGIIIARRVHVVNASMDSKFSQEPTSKQAYRGGVARFSCNIKAEPPTSYEWFKDRKQLSSDRFHALSSGVLQISNVQDSDAGSYICQTTGFHLKNKKSSKASLEVIPDASIRSAKFIAKPVDTTVKEGDAAELECLVDGNPKPSVEWRKKGSDKQWRGQDLVGQGNLVLPGVLQSDEGVYECYNKTLNITASAMLTVEVPPKLLKEPESRQELRGRQVTLKCLVTGNPQPTINWYYNGLPLAEVEEWNNEVDFQREIQAKGGEHLFLHTVADKNSGFYQCVADNKLNQVVALYYLKVAPKKGRIPLEKPTIRVKALSSTSVEVSFEQKPNVTAFATLVYSKPVEKGTKRKQDMCFTKYTNLLLPDGTRIPEAHQRCQLNNLLPATNYSISANFVGKTGLGEHSDRVFVKTHQDVPSELPKVTITSPDVHSMLISWTPLSPKDTRGTLTGYKVFYRMSGKKEEKTSEVKPPLTNFLIQDIEANTTYEVLVIAGTMAGWQNLEENLPWTTYTTPPTNASATLRFKLKYLNTTSIKMEWTDLDSISSSDGKNVNLDIKLEKMGQEHEVIKEISVSPSTTSLVITDLDLQEYYEVSLMQKGQSSPEVKEFQLSDLRYRQMIPSNLKVVDKSTHHVSVDWILSSEDDASYELCYKEVLKEAEECIKRVRSPVVIEDLHPYRRYEFSVRVLMEDFTGKFITIVEQTDEDNPSSPRNLTVEVTKDGTVSVGWQPPLYPNGDLLSYVLMYGKDGPEDTVWKSITLLAPETLLEVDELESHYYLFYVIARNSAGSSPSTKTIRILPLCQPDMPCPTVGLPDKETTTEKLLVEKVDGMSIWMIALIATLVLIFIISMIIICFCCRRSANRRDGDPNTSRAPFFPGNGHVSSGVSHRPGNGHGPKHIVMGTGDVEMRTYESAPMLSQIPENEQSDSKGGNDHHGSVNGLRLNGYIKGGNHVPHGHHIHSNLNFSHTSDELQDLIAASTGDTIMSSGREEKIMLSSLDELDDIDHEEIGDHSSEDSGTGCRRAGMLDSGKINNPLDTSPTNSPGGSSGAYSSLGRQNPGWDRGLSYDEIGGVYVHRSTGDVIDSVGPNRHVGKTRGSSIEVGQNCDENAANDRDSGHGSEPKPQSGIGLVTGYNNSTSGLNNDLLVTPNGEQLLEEPLPLPPPPLPPINSLQSSSLQSSTSLSSQQLPLSSRNVCTNNSQPQTESRPRRHMHARGGRRPISPTDLPPPPPPPPLSAATTLPLSTGPPLAALTPPLAQLNHSSNSSVRGGQQQLNHSGSNSSPTSLESSKAEVAFTRPCPPQNPHSHIA